MSEEALNKVEKEIEELRKELECCNKAKPMGETCADIVKFTEGESEPFTVNPGQSNPWHSNPKGSGGCIIC